MVKTKFKAALLLMLGCCTVWAADNGDSRTIRLRMDDAQTRFASKVYELQNASAEDIAPFITSAVLRYDRNSTIRNVSSSKSSKQAILVSTGREFIPYVDKIVAALDRKVAKKQKIEYRIVGYARKR